MNLHLLKKSRGQAALEFSLMLFAFLVMLFAIGDMIQIAYNWMGIQYASNRGARKVKLVPTFMAHESKSDLIEQEVIRAAGVLGISLNSSQVSAVVGSGSVTIDTERPIQLSPISGFLLQIGGDHSGTYTLRVREAVRNESI